jgi:hypothetical protein
MIPVGSASTKGKLNAVFRFYAELNDFLPPERKFIPFTDSFELRASVKDTIESMGVPHTEIGLMLCNGTSVNFSYAVEDGDRISVYPAFNTLDVCSGHPSRAARELPALARLRCGVPNQL